LAELAVVVVATVAIVVVAPVAIVVGAPVAIVVGAPVAHEGARMGASTGARMAAANMAAANMDAGSAWLRRWTSVAGASRSKRKKKGAYIAVAHRSAIGGGLNNKRIFGRI